jgi:very-short-patch-repair endonuclease
MGGGEEAAQRDVTAGGASADALIWEIAARQHGVVSRAQLIAAGIPAAVLDRRLRAGRLRALHRGVFSAGPVVSVHARALAAAFACGPSAVVSQCTAAALWRIVPPAQDGADVTVNVAGGMRRRAGIRVRRVARLVPDEVTILHGIPITTPARTLVDLADALPSHELERAVAEALALRLTTAARIQALVDRYPRQRPTSRLRTILHGQATRGVPRSKVEALFVALLRRSRIGLPEVNVIVCGFEVDFFWRGEGLVAEVDGYAVHAPRRRFEGDRRRDAELAAAGLRVMRVTWRQINDEPEAVAVRLALALAAARPPIVAVGV